MPQVGAAITAVVAAVSSAALAAGTAAATTIAVSTGMAYATAAAIVNGFTQMVIGIALSAISRALMPTPSGPPVQGTKVRIGLGEDQAASFILGRAATAGDLVYVNSYGKLHDTPRTFLTQVIEIADWPARLRRVWINGEWCTLGESRFFDDFGHDMGYPVEEYRQKKDGQPFLWVRYYDGNQSAADPTLIEHFGGADEEPWTSDMVGRGVPYAIVTARFSAEIHRQKPDCRFEVEGLHYDPRKDSSAGGSGGQRWSNRATWAPTTNLAVLIYNVLRGIRDPITNEFVWGGQGIAERDLPASAWFAAMNECDRSIALKGGGSEPQYHGGLEVRVDTEPASVIEELLKGMQGQLAECAGVWTLVAGPPGAPVFSFTDDDVIITSPDTFDPFPGLDAAFNGISAQYADPKSGWEPKDAPLRMDSTYLAEDGGRHQVANISFLSVFSGTQVQRLMASGLKDQRRFRRHTLVLPPEARKLGLTDEVSWTSARNGYSAKHFAVDALEDMPDGSALMMLRERDPSDYDWHSDNELPEVINPGTRPPVVPQVGNFAVEAAVVKDATGRPRRPAIRLYWTDTANVTAVRYRVRLAADGSHVPGNSSGSGGEGQNVSNTFVGGGNVLTFAGDSLGYVEFDNEDALEVWITEGIVPATAYQVQAIFVPVGNRIWSEWMPVTTGDIRLIEEDLEQEIIDRIDAAFDNADLAGEQSAAALAKANEVEATVLGLSSETIDAAEALAAALELYDAEAINELTGVALAGLRRGYAADPAFHDWTAGVPTHWSGTNLGLYAVQDVTGSISSDVIPPHYNSSLYAQVPAGATVCNLSATSDVSGEIPGADPALQYLAAAALLFIPAGSVAGSTLRIEWWNGSAWVRGKALGAAANLGAFADWGFVVSTTRRQSREMIWEKPTGTMSKVRLWLDVKQASPTAATYIRVDYLDLRPLTEAEIEAHLANEYTDAEITSLETTIVGPGGAIASSATAITTAYQAADTVIRTSVTAVSNAQGATASALESLEATYGDGNMVRNGDFHDGARVAGQAPDYWVGWPADWSVVARGSGSPAVIAAPTPFVASIAPSANQTQARCIVSQPVKPGDMIAVKLKVAGSGTAINFTVTAIISWIGADGVTVASNAQSLAVTSTAWVNSAFVDFTAPAGAATFHLYIRRAAGGTADDGTLFTAVEARFIDAASRALITSASAAAATANAAIATLNNAVYAEFSSYSAWIDASMTAVATAESAQTALVFRNAHGSIGLYSWEDVTGAGAAIKLDARDVIAPGTVSAGEIVVTDLGFNMVPDDQLQSETAWARASQQFSVIPVTTWSGLSIGEVRWTYYAGTNELLISGSRPFPVRPGMILTVEGSCARSGGTTMRAGVRLRFTETDGTYVSAFFLVADTTSGARQILSGVCTVPTGAVRAEYMWFVDQTQTNGGVRFFSPSVIRKEKGTVLITPDSITATEANFIDLASLNLKVVQADIVNAAVDFLQIAGHAVTVPMTATRSSNVYSYDDVTWVTAVDFDVPMRTTGLLLAMASVTAGQDAGAIPGIECRLVVDGTVVFTATSTVTTTSLSLSGAKSVAAGSRGVTLQFRQRNDLGPRIFIDQATVTAMGAQR